MYTDNWNVIWKYELLKLKSLENKNSDFGLERLKSIEKFYLCNYRNKLILDSTCGLGYSTDYLKQRNYNVIGCDISSVAINAAKNNFPDILFYKSSWRNLKNIPYKFDVIYNDYLLWTYTKDTLISYFEGIYDALNENGQCIFFGINSTTNELDLYQKINQRYSKSAKEKSEILIIDKNKRIEYIMKRKLFKDYIEIKFISPPKG